MQKLNDESNETMSPDEIDDNLIGSFPASDPPSWTLGTDHRAKGSLPAQETETPPPIDLANSLSRPINNEDHTSGSESAGHAAWFRFSAVTIRCSKEG